MNRLVDTVENQTHVTAANLQTEVWSNVTVHGPSLMLLYRSSF